MPDHPTDPGRTVTPTQQSQQFDLEYDLCHEATAEDMEHHPAPHEPVYVGTETPDYDGDYGYDMAHDVPGR